MTRSDMPLSRFTVLDLTRVRAGPTAVRQLADWGANVIKIEAPEAVDKARGMGGARHGPDFQNLHRNKRSMTLNLKDPSGHAVFMRMVERADVVVENYRPDVKSRLGVDYPACRSVNPRIVYASISGFGQEGPYRLRPGFDQIAQGMGGLMWITGLPGQGPVRVGVPIADLAGGLYASIGIFIALLGARGDRRGTLGALLPARGADRDARLPGRALDGGGRGPAPGRERPPDEHPDRGVRDCGRIHQHRVQRRSDVAAAVRRPGRRRDARRSALPRPAGPRSDNRERLNERIGTFTIERTSAEWIDALNRAGVPCGPIYRMDEMWADPQVEHLGMKRPTRHPRLGEVNVVRNAVNIEGVPSMPYTHTAERGEHTEEVLGEFGLTADEIDDMRTRNVI